MHTFLKFVSICAVDTDKYSHVVSYRYNIWTCVSLEISVCIAMKPVCVSTSGIT